MDNFKTIAAVLVVLIAFTGFQLIANYSLRSAVRADVARQISKTEDQVTRHNEQLKQAYEISGSLAQSMADLQSQFSKMTDDLAATNERLAQISAKAAENVEALNALDVNIAALAKKIEEMKKSADSAKHAEANVSALDAQVRGLGAEISSASQNASLALSTAQKVQSDLAVREANGDVDKIRNQVTDLRSGFDQLSTEIRNLQNARR